MIFSGLYCIEICLGFIGTFATIASSQLVEYHGGVLRNALACCGRSTVWILGLHGAFLRYVNVPCRYLPIQIQVISSFLFAMAGMLVAAVVIRRICYATRHEQMLTYIGLK